MDQTILLVVQQTINDIIREIEIAEDSASMSQLGIEWRQGERIHNGSCSRCNGESFVVSARCGGNRDFLSFPYMSDELICQSCIISSSSEDKRCFYCGVSNKLTDDHGRDMTNTGIDDINEEWKCFHCSVKEIEENAYYLAMEVHYDDEDPDT